MWGKSMWNKGLNVKLTLMASCPSKLCKLKAQQLIKRAIMKLLWGGHLARPNCAIALNFYTKNLATEQLKLGKRGEVISSFASSVAINLKVAFSRR